MAILAIDAFGEDAVVPDAYYVHQRCAAETAKTLGDVLEPLSEPDRTKLETLNNEIIRLCQDYDDAKVSADRWFRSIQVLAQQKRFLYPCSACMRIPLPPRAPLPSNFASYSLLLFPSAEWEQHDHQKDVEALQTAFSNFGDSLGNRQAAVWFSKSGGSVFPPDSERAKFYCDRFKLNYSDGPFLIASKRRPDQISDRDELIVIRLSGLTPTRAIRVLNILEQDLRTDSEIRRRALLYEEIKQRLFSVSDRRPDLEKESMKDKIELIVK